MKKYLCRKCGIIDESNILKDGTCDICGEKPVLELEDHIIKTLQKQLCKENTLEKFLNELKKIAKKTKIKDGFEWFVQFGLVCAEISNKTNNKTIRNTLDKFFESL